MAGSPKNPKIKTAFKIILITTQAELMNAVLPGKDYEFGTNQQGDTAVNFGPHANE